MTDITLSPPRTQAPALTLRHSIGIGLAIICAVLAFGLANAYAEMPIDSPALSESALAQLGVWMAAQSEKAAPVSVLGNLAKSWAAARGQATLLEGVAVHAARWPLVIVFGVIAACGVLAAGLRAAGGRGRTPLLIAVGLWTTALFFVPTTSPNDALPRVLMGLAAALIAGAMTGGSLSRVAGFLLALAALLGGVEGLKLFAQANAYAITVPMPNFSYVAYETPESAFDALESGAVRVILADSKILEAAAVGRDGVLITKDGGRDEYRIGLPIRPTMPARIGFAVRADDFDAPTGIEGLGGVALGTLTGDFAQTNYLDTPRLWVLLDLKIFTDLNLPHLETIMEAFLQPARRNGEFLLGRILGGNALYTWTEAALGFTFGALLGFGLGAAFAHSRLLERGLLPYVIASQTVPILAIAPMVVIWLGAGPIAVSVISAYLTFFPVTINTLRGLSSPNPLQVDLMRSMAANRWDIFVKLRLPAAVPYIFTALKVSATASVVGAIIGELPSSVREGLARAILDFSSNYSEISTPKLFAAIVAAAGVGIFFFLLVSLVERVALRRFIPHTTE